MHQEDIGLRISVNDLAGSYKTLIVATLLDGPLTLPNLYRQVPSNGFWQFTHQLFGLWRSGLVQIQLVPQCGLRCRLTKTGQSLRDLIIAMSQWGQRAKWSQFKK